MSALRFTILAAVLLAGAVRADDNDGMGSSGSCPPAASSRLYANTSSTACPNAQTCYTDYCNCLGLNHTSGLECSAPSTWKACSATVDCTATVISCLNNAASTCPNLKDLQMSILALESGAVLYNESTAYTACRHRSCVLVNASAGSNCTLNYKQLCKPPVAFRAVLALRGNFSQILLNPVQRENLAAALEADLRRTMRYEALYVIYLWLQASLTKGPRRPTPASVNQRQNGDDILLVEFEAPGVTAKNEAFAQRLTVVKANSDWLTTTKSTLTQYGAGELTVVGVAEGSGASAFSSGVLPPPGSTPQPPTPVPPTPQPPSPTTAGAAMHRVLAAAFIALLSALLF